MVYNSITSQFGLLRAASTAQGINKVIQFHRTARKPWWNENHIKMRRITFVKNNTIVSFTMTYHIVQPICQSQKCPNDLTPQPIRNTPLESPILFFPILLVKLDHV